jgi:hypothetical protein
MPIFRFVFRNLRGLAFFAVMILLVLCALSIFFLPH